MKSNLLKHLIETKKKIIKTIEESDHIAKNDILFLNDILFRIDTLKSWGFDLK